MEALTFPKMITIANDSSWPFICKIDGFYQSTGYSSPKNTDDLPSKS